MNFMDKLVRIDLVIMRLDEICSAGGSRHGHVAAVGEQAMAQVSHYLADAALQRHPVRHVGIALVFRGWELAFCESVEAA